VSVQSFLTAARAEGICTGALNANDHVVNPERRRDAVRLAADHGVHLIGIERYTARITGSGRGGLTSPVPAEHLAVGLAHVLLDWHARIPTGRDIPELSYAVSSSIRDVRDLTLGAGILHITERKAVARALGTGAYDWLRGGEYGTDPQPVDARHEAFATFVRDRLDSGTYWRPHTGLAAMVTLDAVDLIDAAGILSEPARTVTVQAPRPGEGHVR
jgi:hypothetical protein